MLTEIRRRFRDIPDYPVVLWLCSETATGSVLDRQTRTWSVLHYSDKNAILTRAEPAPTLIWSCGGYGPCTKRWRRHGRICYRALSSLLLGIIWKPGDGSGCSPRCLPRVISVAPTALPCQAHSVSSHGVMTSVSGVKGFFFRRCPASRKPSARLLHAASITSIIRSSTVAVAVAIS